MNNRNLRTLDVDVHASEELIAHVPADVIAVSESGLRTADDLVRLGQLGYRAFLIGERLMTADDPGAALKDLVTAVLTTKDTKDTREYLGWTVNSREYRVDLPDTFGQAGGQDDGGRRLRRPGDDGRPPSGFRKSPWDPLRTPMRFDQRRLDLRPR